MKFEIGEIAIGQNFTRSPEYNGLELKVVDNYGEHVCRGGVNGFPFGPIKLMGYGVEDGDGEIFYVPSNRLRKKKPPEELTSWDKIEEICGWSPYVNA